MALVFLGIGANLGDRRGHCERAVALLRARADIVVTAQSAWKEYPALTPRPDERQPAYVNGVVQLETPLAPAELLRECLAIECALGRSRSETSTPGAAEPLIRQRREDERWAPRTIDIDILFYDDLVMATPTLTIPHPELTKRLFVLEPLAMLVPDWIHPVQQKTIAQLLSEVVVTDDGRRTTDDRG